MLLLTLSALIPFRGQIKLELHPDCLSSGFISNFRLASLSGFFSRGLLWFHHRQLANICLFAFTTPMRRSFVSFGV